MAKQTGLYHIRGKVGDYKYYGMKGVDGTIMAKQNEGMSERVKTDAAYENTRRNNYEFGMATSTAGAITKAFSQKWRYLLVPFATAKVAKEILGASKVSSAGGWGDRALTAAQLAPVLPAIMQKFTKNPISDFLPISVTTSESEGITSIVVSCDNMLNEKAKAAGCDGVRVLVYENKLIPASGGYSDLAISQAVCESKMNNIEDVDMGNDFSTSAVKLFNDTPDLVSVILLPYRTIGDEKYIMQEFCSAQFINLPVE